MKVKSVNRPSTAKARTLRRRFTDAELKLWNHLRGRRIGGEKFRRQQPLGRYVVDFICLEKKLIVEVDGGHHAAPEYDKERTTWLESEGFRVIRFWNNEVLRDIGIVLDAIYMELKSGDMYHPHPSPLPSRERVKKQARWDKAKGGMKRKRSESIGNGLGIFEGYDPVVESMLLEWEVDRQGLPKEFLLPRGGEGQDEGDGQCPLTIDVAGAETKSTTVRKVDVAVALPC